jgi:hypothetical protein
MGVNSVTTIGRSEWGTKTDGRRMYVFTNGGVTADVQVVWYQRTPSDEAISIMFGDEQITLDFYDMDSLERLRDVADQAAQRLRAVIEANTIARTAERTGALVGVGSGESRGGTPTS